MFVEHYSASFAAKALVPRISLWLLFVLQVLGFMKKNQKIGHDPYTATL